MASVPHFYYHDRMREYDFGPRHPLKPERLARLNVLLDRFAAVDRIDPGLAAVEDLERVHAPELIRAVQDASAGERLPEGLARTYGIGTTDTPAFVGMFEASLAYCGGAVAAAQAINEGAPLAFNMAGGLHHAHRSYASGFCVFNDAAIACSILKERFGRVAYIDIDVHHGDGVQSIFWNDPSVLTCSIHQMSPGFYPGTGRVEEMGVDDTCVNIPLPDETTGDTWIWAFREGILPAIDRFQPGALVLQMGADPHFLDPLAHFQVSAQEWLEAVSSVKRLGLPILACGGGGYCLSSVVRMWTAAVLTLAEIDFPNSVPEDLAEAWDMPTMFDAELPKPRLQGMEFAERIVSFLRTTTR